MYTRTLVLLECVLVKNISIDQNTSSILLVTPYNNNFINSFINNFNKIITTFTKPLFKKIKFKGKGYYIYKNKRNTVTPQFGHSHRIYVYSFFMGIKFLSKTSVLVFGINSIDLIQITLKIKLLRPINIFTGRGLRFSKQIIYKKTGKVSSYR
jgi:ribosomal protein L6P/L9E